MRSYIGTARKLANTVEVFPQYRLQNEGDLTAELQPPFPIGNNSDLIGIVRVDYDENGSKLVKVSKFPHAADRWVPAIERPTNIIDSIKSSGSAGPWAACNPIPKSPKGLFVLHGNGCRLFGPISPTSLIKEKTHLQLNVSCDGSTEDTAISSDNAIVRFIKSPSSKQNFHLLLVRKDKPDAPDSSKLVAPAADETPDSECSVELPKTENDNNQAVVDKLMQPLALKYAQSLYSELPMNDLHYVKDDRPISLIPLALRLSLEVADVRKQIMSAQKAILQETEHKDPGEVWEPILQHYIIPAFETKLDSIQEYCRQISQVFSTSTGERDDSCFPRLLAMRQKHLTCMKGLINSAEVLHCKDATELYEYYCLLRLLSGIKELGFHPSNKSTRYIYGGKVPRDNKGSERLNNTFYFTKGENTILTLYREPLIRDDAFENGLRIFRRDCISTGSGSSPDFVIKLTQGRSQKETYVILDAKFAEPKNIERTYLPLVLNKYYLKMGLQRKSDRIAMVWTLQGRPDGSEPYLGQTPSPLEKKFGGFPSFGNCTVNEINPSGMDTFWEVFKKLLPAETEQDPTPSLPLPL